MLDRRESAVDLRRAHIPEQDLVVISTADKDAAIRLECQAGDPFVRAVAEKLLEEGSGPRVDEENPADVVSQGQEASIRTAGHLLDPASASDERSQVLERAQTQDLDPALSGGDRVRGSGRRMR